MKKVAIIGFGFCGRIAAFHLAQRFDIELIIFDKQHHQNNLGTAFSQFSKHYILNVEASQMSAFSDKENDFCNFLKNNFPQNWQEIQEKGFAPRYLYGLYLKQITAKVLDKLKFVNEEVKSIESSFLITTDKSQYQVDEIILATSFQQSNLPKISAQENVIDRIWNQNYQNFHATKPNHQSICLIGAGLTAVDVLVKLLKEDYQGDIFVVSRRGNLPKPHPQNKKEITLPINNTDARQGILHITKKIRHFLKLNPEINLIDVVMNIRNQTFELWQNLDQKNKQKFLRLMPYWNIIRHRAPQSSIKAIDQAIKKGQIKLIKDGVTEIIKNQNKFLITSKNKNFTCDLIINCLGFEMNASKYPLLKQMIEVGLLKQDLLMAQSNHSKIHLAGGLNIGRDFECTSVPDLRKNIEAIIKKI